MESGPVVVDSEIARAPLPAAEYDQAGADLRFIHRAVDVADHDEIGRIAALRAVVAKHPQVALFVVGEPALIPPGKNSIKSARDRAGQEAKADKEWPAFHPRLPEPARA